ncbi:MAG: four helix bundle protein [Candidatus Acidiferrales bacterium]
MKIRSFEELEVWQVAHALALRVYQVTARFPREEQFGLTSQLRRASSSVPANIAEGFGRRTTKELLRSLRVANGEVEEIRYFCLLSRDLGYVSRDESNQLNAMCASISKLLSALGRSLANLGARVTSHQSPVTQKAGGKP